MVPEESDKLTIFVITGNSISKQFFITEAGKGSRSHELSGDYRVYSLIASGLTITKSHAELRMASS